MERNEHDEVDEEPTPEKEPERWEDPPEPEPDDRGSGVPGLGDAGSSGPIG